MPSAIEWTDETWNPVTGCTRISPGCDNCYMYAMYPRLRAMGVPGYADGPEKVRLQHERLGLPYGWTKPRRVFVNSMSDAFHQDVPDNFILRMFKVMEESSREHGHIFQVLTKRPGRAAAWWASHAHYFDGGWPANVWLGTSVENQKYAPRLTVLARVPAPIRFASVEPLLEPIDLSHWLTEGAVSWVIVGGESGRRAREMKIEWVRSLAAQCRDAGVSLFVKQLGSVWSTREKAAPKGGELREWPKDIQIRTYPRELEASRVGGRRTNGVQRRTADTLSGARTH